MIIKLIYIDILIDQGVYFLHKIIDFNVQCRIHFRYTNYLNCRCLLLRNISMKNPRTWRRHELCTAVLHRFGSLKVITSI